MKKISRLIQLLPAAGLEKFPTHLKGELAAGVLANWTAAWHPLLIAAANAAPVVVSAESTQTTEDESLDVDFDDPADESDLIRPLDAPLVDPLVDPYDDSLDDAIFDDDLQPSGQDVQPHPDPAVQPDADFWNDSLIFVPEITLQHIGHGFAARVVGANAKLITGLHNRDQIIARVAELTQIDLGTPTPCSDDASMIDCADFYALGYAYLQIQLMTRKIRYSSNLNQQAFNNQLIDASKFFAAADHVQCRAAIDACYDLLAQEKNNYYPVRPTLIDLVLTTPHTVDARLKQELASNHPLNLHFTAETIDAADRELIDALKSAIEQQRVSVVGGNDLELPDTLLSPESTLNQLQRGCSRLQTRLQYDVGVFMRQRFGLMASIPNLLNQLEFTGAMHTSLRGGKFPTGSMGTIRWSGDGKGSIIAKAETLLDASDPATMLDLGVKIGKQIDSAHESTCTFAHWPGRCDQTFKDLLRVAKRSEVLGVWLTLDDHFDSVYDPGYDDNFSSEEYVAPFLNEAIAQQSTVPLSTTIHYWRHYYRLQQIRGLVALLAVETLQSAPSNPQDADTVPAPPVRALPFTGNQIRSWVDRCDQWQQQIDAATADWNFNPESHRQLTQSIDDGQQQLVAAISMIKSADDTSPSFPVLLNPLFFNRQVVATLPDDPSWLSFYKSKRPHLIHQKIDQGSDCKRVLCAEIKGTGMTPAAVGLSVAAGETALWHSEKNAIHKEPSVLDGDKLQNEFFVATVDRKTGALRNLLFHGQRGNRCSQRLIWQNGPSSPRSTMVCDTFETTAIGIVGGAIKTTGRIVANNQTVANFTQTFELYRGQSVLKVAIDLQPTIDVGNSKQKYFAHRVAWRDEGCKIFGSDQFVISELYSPQIQSPNFVHIQNLDYSLTLLSGGLAYHHRIDRRQLDTLLITGNESQRSFEIGLGIDLKYPLKSAIDFATPVLTMPSGPSKATQYFHLDSKNVLVTSVRPVFSDDQRVIGFDFRFQETQRRGGKTTLYLPFKISTACRTNFKGVVTQRLLQTPSPEATQVEFEFAAADYFQIRILTEPNVDV